MRLLLVGFGVAALAGIGWIFAEAVRDSREWHEVQAFAEKDLKVVTMDEQSRVGQLLRERFPREEFGATLPWFGVRLPGPQGSERVLIFHTLSGSFAPAFLGIFVSVFDEDRRHLSLVEILPGYAANVVDARGAVVGAPGPWYFDMTVDPKRENGRKERHVYVLRGNRPVLARLEEGSGALRPNEYARILERVGEPVPDRSPEEWVRMLESSDLGEVLPALTWLGGEHADPGFDSNGDDEESPASRRAFRDTLPRPGVKARLRELLGHPHPWVAEAAAQVELPD